MGQEVVWGHALTSGRTSFANLKTSKSFARWTWKSDFNERVQQTEFETTRPAFSSYVILCERASKKCYANVEDVPSS